MTFQSPSSSSVHTHTHSPTWENGYWHPSSWYSSLLITSGLQTFLLCKTLTPGFSSDSLGWLACMSATVRPRESRPGDIRQQKRKKKNKKNFKAAIRWSSKVTERAEPPAIGVQSSSSSTNHTLDFSADTSAAVRDNPLCPYCLILSQSLVLIGYFRWHLSLVKQAA